VLLECQSLVLEVAQLVRDEVLVDSADSYRASIPFKTVQEVPGSAMASSRGRGSKGRSMPGDATWSTVSGSAE
jgi:hypothetical protein